MQLGLGKSTAKVFTNDFVDAIFEHHDECIKFPDDRREVKETISDFDDFRNFPPSNCCSGWNIYKSIPKDKRDDHICQKGFSYLILQGTVGTKRQFCDVAIGFPDSLLRLNVQPLKLDNTLSELLTFQVSLSVRLCDTEGTFNPYREVCT